MMRTIEQVNAALNALWEAQSFPKSLKVYGPMQYRKPKVTEIPSMPAIVFRCSSPEC
jgi:hypothetical protein